jgi:hypothetical protein
MSEGRFAMTDVGWWLEWFWEAVRRVLGGGSSGVDHIAGVSNMVGWKDVELLDAPRRALTRVICMALAPDRLDRSAFLVGNTKFMVSGQNCPQNVCEWALQLCFEPTIKKKNKFS